MTASHSHAIIPPEEYKCRKERRISSTIQTKRCLRRRSIPQSNDCAERWRQYRATIIWCRRDIIHNGARSQCWRLVKEDAITNTTPEIGGGIWLVCDLNNKTTYNLQGCMHGRFRSRPKDSENLMGSKSRWTCHVALSFSSQKTPTLKPQTWISNDL